MAHHKRVWFTQFHHLLAWVLSVETARRHYPDTVLFTDDEGAHLLVEQLGLEFSHVSTELNALRESAPQWWVLGKLWTYRAQTAPFVHIDSDVFLWKSLPVDLDGTSVLAQNQERFPFHDETWYRPMYFERVVKSVNGWLPEEWIHYTSRNGSNAVCCGILGGTAVDFINYYADSAIRVIEHRDNRVAWDSIGSSMCDNILIEQYFLSACIDFHRTSELTKYEGIGVRYLFSSLEQAFNEAEAARVGFTHLIGRAKANPLLSKRLEDRVRRDYPESYERCLRVYSSTPALFE